MSPPKELAACDGHKLVRVRTDVPGVTLGEGRPGVGFEPFHLHRDTITAIKRLTEGRGKLRMTWRKDSEAIAIDLDANHGLRVTVTPKPLDFPPIDQIMTAHTPTDPPPRLTMAPKFFADVRAVVDAIYSDYEGVTVTVTGWGGELSPLQLEAGGDLAEGGPGAVRFVIMPMRLGRFARRTRSRTSRKDRGLGRSRAWTQ